MPAGDVYGSVDNPESIRGLEKNIRRLNYEVGGGFTKDGKPLFTQTKWAPNYIGFTKEQMAQLLVPSNRGAIFTHNHPGSSSFSGADISFFARNHLSEMRIVSRKFEYTLRDPNGFFKTQETGQNEAGQRNFKFPFSGGDNIDDTLVGLVKDNEKQNLIRNAAKETGKPIADIKLKDYRVGFFHLAMTRFAKKYGLEYTRKRLD